MRRLVLSLDALPALRESSGMRDCDLSAAATLAELAGATAVRLGLGEELRPVSELDVLNLRRTARALELRMPASQSLVKVALEARPDRVVLASEAWEGRGSARPIDPRADAAVTINTIRSLDEAGIPVSALILPEVEAVKAMHGLGVRGVEFCTAGLVDLPEAERRSELVKLGDAARIASKLRIATIGIAGGLDFYSTPEVLRAAPVADGVTIGRGIFARAFLTGIDRVVRDFRELLVAG